MAVLRFLSRLVEDDPRPTLDERVSHAVEILRELGARFDGHAERVGNGAELRCSLCFGDERWEACWRTDDPGDDLSARFSAQLPVGNGRFELAPQEGFGSLLKRWVEVKLGEKTVDDFYLISANDDGAAVLRASVLELARLMPSRPHLTLSDTTLEIDRMRIHAEVGAVERAVDAALEVWRRCVRARLPYRG